MSARSGELATAVETAFTASGYTVRVEEVEPSDIEERLDAAVASRPDVLLVGGGDGTIRSAAIRVAGHPISLAVLPLGTLNRLARDLKIPLTPDEAIMALSRATPREIDAAEVNGRLFLCNSLIGIPPAVAAERQRLRGAGIADRVRGYFDLLARVTAARRRLLLAIDNGQEQKVLRVMSLAVSNNTYGEDPSLLLSRPSLDRGELGVYISKHRTGLGLLGVLARTALGGWSGDPAMERVVARHLTISSRSDFLTLSNDGEIEKMETPLRYRVLPRALTVLTPTTEHP